MLTILKKELNINLFRIKHTITANKADGYLANLLDVRFVKPILVIQRNYFDEHDTPFQYTRHSFRGDKYAYRVELCD
jgi:DNA-binding GntR family transcriptional regulator